MNDKMSVKQWVATLFIVAIPLVNLIFLLLWAVDKEDPRRNYARATMIVFSTIIGLALILGLLGVKMDSFSTQTQTPSYDYFYAQVEYDKELNENLEVLDIAPTKLSDRGWQAIDGKVRNNSNETSYSGFVIECNAYDNDNTIIFTFDVVIEDTIPPGEILKFVHSVYSSHVFAVKPINIRNK